MNFGAGAPRSTDAKPKPSPQVNTAFAVALFLRVYGPQTLRGPGWPTRDGVIPWQMFWLLYCQIPRIQAMERLNESTAVAHAIAVSFAGKDPAVEQHTRDELKLLFPDE